MKYPVVILACAIFAGIPFPAQTFAQVSTIETRVSGCTFSPDSKLALVTYSINAWGKKSMTFIDLSVTDVLRLYDLGSGKEIRQLQLKSYLHEPCYSVAFLPDSRHVVLPGEISNGSDRAGMQLLEVWDVIRGERIRTFEKPSSNTSWVSRIAVSADGKKVLASYIDYTVRLWDVETGKLLRTFDNNKLDHRYSLNRVALPVALSPDGKLAIFRGDPEDKEFAVWNLETGQVVRKGVRDTGAGRDFFVAFCPSGKYVVTKKELDDSGQQGAAASSHCLSLCDMATGKEVRTFATAASSIAFRDDGKYLVSSTDGKFGFDLRRTSDGKIASSSIPNDQCAPCVKIWEVESGRELWCWKMPRDEINAQSTYLSPDGRLLITDCGGQTTGKYAGDSLLVRLWDVDSQKEVHVLRDYQGRPKKADPDHPPSKWWQLWK